MKKYKCDYCKKEIKEGKSLGLEWGVARDIGFENMKVGGLDDVEDFLFCNEECMYKWMARKALKYADKEGR